MSTRRSKRRPANRSREEDDESATDAKNRRITGKVDRGGVASRNGPSYANSTHRKSARQRSAAVDYRDGENSSDDDDFEVRNDPEYKGSGEEKEKDSKRNSGTRKRRVPKEETAKVGKDGRSDSDGDSVGMDLKTTAFEVSKLQTEIDLSSDNDSGEEDVGARTGEPAREETDAAAAASDPRFTQPGERVDLIEGSKNSDGGPKVLQKTASKLSSDEDTSDVGDEVEKWKQKVEVESSSHRSGKMDGSDMGDVDGVGVSGSAVPEEDPVDSSSEEDTPSGEATEQDGGSVLLPRTDAATTSSPYFTSKKQSRGKGGPEMTEHDGSGADTGLRKLSEKVRHRQVLSGDEEEGSLDKGKQAERVPPEKVSRDKLSKKKTARKRGNVRARGKSEKTVSGKTTHKAAGTDNEDVHSQQRDGTEESDKKKNKAVVNMGRRKSIVLPEESGIGTEVGDTSRRKRPRRACKKSPTKGTKKGKPEEVKEIPVASQEVPGPSSSGLKGPQTKKGARERRRGQSAGKLKLKKPSDGVDDEGGSGGSELKQRPVQPGGDEDVSESSDEEWEDVEDIHVDGSGTPKKKRLTDKVATPVVEIDIELPGAERKRKKAYDWADYYRRELNRVKKERQVEMHKVHLLCLLANGFHRNSVCNDDLLLSTALSIIPPDVAKARPKKLNMNFVYKLLFWYRKHFGINSSLPRFYRFPVYQLLQGMQAGVFSSEEEFVMVFVLCIRCLWGDARLMLSLQPMTWKAKIIEKNAKGKTAKHSSHGASPEQPAPSSSETSLSKAPASKTPPSKTPSSKTSSTKLETSKTKKAPSASKKSKTSDLTPAKRARKLVSTAKELAVSLPLKTEDGRSSQTKKGAPTKREHGDDENGADVVQKRNVKEEFHSRESEAQSSSSHKRTARSRSVRAERVGASGGKVKKEETADDSRAAAVDVGFRGVRKRGQGNSSTTSKRKTSIVAPGISEDSERIQGVNSTDRPKRTNKGSSQSVSDGNKPRDIGRSRRKHEPKEEDGGGKLRKPQMDQGDGGRSLRKRKATRRVQQKRGDEESDDEEKMSDEGSNYSEEEWIHQKKSSRKKKKRKSMDTHQNTSRGSVDTTMSSESDFEDEIENLSMKRPKSASGSPKLNNSILSSDTEESVKEVKCNKPKKAAGVDVWCEVFLPAQNLWVSVDCMQGYVNKPHELETRATQPLLYVLGFDNDNSVKDLTQRYASKWMAHNIKLRIQEDWWQQTLSAYRSKKKKRDKDEDAQMQTHHLDQPLPKSIVEYKNHPLYALERHLLKFEAIYPPTAAVLGYCKGEPVYSRECVHTLKSIHTWMKEGIAVKDGEKPYKFVKKLVNPFKRYMLTPEEQNQMLDVYGEWQTELFVPPPAKDGIVPRNEYGNVELFVPSMLPEGTVHLKIPGLNKVASKLDIDCAPAMMGWEFHKRFVTPVLDGFVVCEEVADVLVAAWEEEQVEMEKKRKLKKEQKAMKHWKHLIKSLLIRERLKEKYHLEEEPPTPAAKGKGEGKKGGTKAYWPENKMTSFKGDASNLLPFEKKS